MDSPRHTLILIPHGRSRSRRLRFSTLRALALLLVTSALLFVAGGSIAAWIVHRDKGADLQQVRRQNQELRAANQRFDRELESLQQRLEEFQRRTRELAIMSGVEPVFPDPTEKEPSGEVEDSQNPQPEDRVGSLWNQTEELWRGLDRVEARFAQLAALPTVRPAVGPITSFFGPRHDPLTGGVAYHRGVDIAASPGSLVRAAGDGVVTRAGRRGGFGRAVTIRHGSEFVSRYAHLASVRVQPGTRVYRREPIGTVGHSGRTTGYHLHFEVHRDRRPVDPLAHLLPPRLRLAATPSPADSHARAR